MSAVFIIFSVLRVILVLLFVLICLRAFASWFSAGTGLAAIELLNRITNPFIKPFAKMRIARLGNINLGIIYLGLILWLGIQICSQLIAINTVSLPFTLLIIVNFIFQTTLFLCIFFMVLGAVRLVGSFFTATAYLQRVWSGLDHLISPMIYPIASRIFRNQVPSYRAILILYILLWAMILLVTWLICIFLVDLIYLIPVAK